MGMVMWNGETPDASSLDGRGDVEVGRLLIPQA